MEFDVEIMRTFAKDATVERLRDLLNARLGVVLPETLGPRMARELQEYIQSSPGGWRGLIASIETSPASANIIRDLADICTVTHTYFFREPSHFDFVKEVAFPELASSNIRDLRIWSAASASGEEPYSILMTMLDHFGETYPSLDAGVLATDISRRALTKAAAGVYHSDALRYVPAPFTRKWFSPCEGGWAIDQRVKQEATFRWLNLVDPFPAFRAPFHIIFCRNVLLYFDEARRAAVIEKLSHCLAPGGWLIIGQAEDSKAARNWLSPVTASIYRKSQRN